MRISIVAALCLSLITSAIAQTLTIETDPPGHEVWRGEENLGKSPVTIEGPFDGPVEITVKSPKGDKVSVVDVPEEGENAVVVISVDDGNPGKTVLYATLAGLLGMAVVGLFYLLLSI